MTINPGTAGGAVPSRAQVVIVGGGVTGCSIAYHLAHLGWTDVVLLEQHQLTAGTTWHAAGLITSAGMTDETALFFSRYSRDLYSRLEQETGHSTGFRPVGHISLATSPRRQEALRREAAWMAWLRGRGCGDLAAGAGGPVAAGPHRRRAVRLLRRRRGPGRPGRRGHLAGQGRPAAGGPDRRGRGRDRGGDPRAPGDVPCSPTRAGSRPRWWSTRRACGPGSSGPWPGSAFRSRRPSITTCSPTPCRGWTRTCRSSRTRTTTATTGPRATACWSGCSSRSPPPGRWTGCPAGFRSGK